MPQRTRAVLRSYLLFLILLISGILHAQPRVNMDSLRLREFIRSGDSAFSRQSYDSAITLYKKAYELAKIKNLLSYYSASNCLLLIGNCYYLQLHYALAHQYFFAALQNARRYSNHSPLKIAALRGLNYTHYYLQLKDSTFHYPVKKDLSVQKMAFVISKILYHDADSVVVEISGGAYDGIGKDQREEGQLYSINDPKQKVDYAYAGSARLIRVGNNNSVVSLKPGKRTVQTGWLVKLNAAIPERLSHSTFIDEFREEKNWKNSDGYPGLFNRRFYYYYYDEKLDQDITDLFREELKVVIDRFAKDTLDQTHFASRKCTDGMFQGRNLVKALAESDNAAIHYFLGFVEDFRSSYVGQGFKFSEAYATWMTNNTPMRRDDARKFILGDEQFSQEMIRRSALLYKQAEENNWPANWVDEALQEADKNYLRSVLSYGRLLHHYGKASGKAEYIGWGNFMDALRQKAFGRMARCDSFLTVAYESFQKANAEEGMQWVRSTRRSILDTTNVQINIQSGHLMPYDIYPSPNQRYFATGSEDFTIKIWDIALAKEVRSINGHTAEVRDLAYNPGGRYLASISNDSTVKIWNTFNYGLMNEFRPAKLQRDIEFSPNGEFLVSSGYDSTINFWDPFTGKLVRSFRSPGGFTRQFIFNPRNKNQMYLTCTDSAVYIYDLSDNKYSRMFRSQKIITGFYASRNGRYGCFYRSDSTVNILDLDKGEIIFSSDVYAWNLGKERYLSTGDFSPDSRYFVYCHKDEVTVFLDLESLRNISYPGYPAKQFLFNSDGSYYIKQEPYSAPVIVNFAGYNPDDTSKKRLTSTSFVTHVNPVFKVMFTADDRKLHFSSLGIHQLDLGNGMTSLVYPNHDDLNGQNVPQGSGDLHFYKRYKVRDSIFLYSTQQKKTLLQWSLPGGEEISSYAWLENEPIVLLTGSDGSIAGWNPSNGEQLFHRKNAIGRSARLTAMAAIPGTDRVIVYGSEIKPHIVNSRTGAVIDSIDTPKTGWITVANGEIYISSNQGRLFVVDRENYKIKRIVTIHNTPNYLYDIVASKNGKLLYILSDDFCFVVETSGFTVVSRFQPRGGNLAKMALSHDEKTLAICSFNSQIGLYEPGTGRLKAHIFVPFPNETVIADSAGHYLASKKNLQAVIFSYGGRAYNYDQFDLQLNQPHRVLASIGRADSITLRTYESAYKKRLLRNRLTSDATIQARLPGLIILNRSLIKPTTTVDYCDIQVESFDVSAKLAALKVFVNDVPLVDSGGKWSKLDTNSIVTVIRIPLTTGNNKIKLLAVNRSGISSLRETINIYCNAPQQKQTTYFIGIGVNTYADASMNLVYSAKDIRDMAASFKKIYPGIIIDTLINKQVTLKNIEELRNRLKKVRVTDRVIMAVTGHGLLSDSLDFYYATYDVDFKNPVKKGWRYEDLEGLLNGTAARQKLLLIDACHSGMVDKESLLDAKEEVPGDQQEGMVKVKGARGLKRSGKSSSESVSSFDLMQSLFTDLSNDNGIIVISAAGGLEYAFESKKWNNGVFTYCVLNAIEEKEADRETEGGNEDGDLSVQELMRYVSKKVPELTKGEQRPTSRRENIEFDWIIAKKIR